MGTMVKTVLLEDELRDMVYELVDYFCSMAARVYKFTGGKDGYR